MVIHFSFLCCSRIYRLSKNFEIVRGSLTTFAEIMSRCQSEKENISFELPRSDVVALVRQLFGGEVLVF